MTDLTRPVRRRVVSRMGTTLIVTLAPEGIWFREPRRRVGYLAEYGPTFQRLVRAAVDDEKRRKAAEKKARRLAR